MRTHGVFLVRAAFQALLWFMFSNAIIATAVDKDVPAWMRAPVAALIIVMLTTCALGWLMVAALLLRRMRRAFLWALADMPSRRRAGRWAGTAPALLRQEAAIVPVIRTVVGRTAEERWRWRN